MTKDDLIQKIINLKLIREFALITFTNNKDKFFQFFGPSHKDLRNFINWNFNEYQVKEIKSVNQTKFGTVIVIIE